MEDKQIQNTDRVEEQTQETSIKQQLTKSFFGMYNEKSINKYVASIQAKLDGRDLLVQKHSETAARLEKENAKYAAQAEACNELIRSLLLEFKRQIGHLTAISQLYNQSESSMLRIMKDNVEAHGRRLNLFDEENAQEAAAEQESHEAGDDAASASIKATDNKTEEWHPQAETRTEPHQGSMTEAFVR